MTDYNDGNWHGWNGGKCPVHPISVVQAVRGSRTSADVVTWKAGEFQDHCWSDVEGQHSITAFRVVQEHKEPREFWISNNDGFAHDSLDSVLSDPLTEKHGYTHVREVIK